MNVVLQTHSQEAFTWTVDANDATLADLRDSIRQVVTAQSDDSETIMIQHPDLPSSSLEPLTSDEKLRIILWIRIKSAMRVPTLLVHLHTPSKAISDYTLSEVNSLYNLGYTYVPTLEELPALQGIESAALDSEEQTIALRRLCDQLKSMQDASYLDEKQQLITHIDPFLLQATALFRDQLMAMSGGRIAGRRGYGVLHSTIMAKDDWSNILPVTAVRNGNFEDAVAQNMVQLETASKGRKRKFSAEDDENLPLVNYGIVTDARKWYFVECTRDPTSEATPTFCTSQLPGRDISYSRNEVEWREDVGRIFKHVVWLADKMAGTIADRQKRARK